MDYNTNSILSRLWILIFLLLPSQTFAQTVKEYPYVTNGAVKTIATNNDGSIIYIGGEFTKVGPNTGHGVALDTSTGAYDSAFPKVNGNINTVVSDGAAGWYIGGTFTKVGSIQRSNIAHIKSDKSLDESWNPNADNTVITIAVSGNTVYVGGSFGNIGGQTRNRIAALDAVTGEATSWNPNSNNAVGALAVSGTTIYVGGNFSTIGGQSRSKIAALDSTTGDATSWAPVINGSVSTIAVSGTTVYIGGGFTTVEGMTRNRAAAVDATLGVVTVWDPNSNGSLTTLAISNGIVYVGGNFTNIGGQTRNRIAALDSTTGVATSWNPNSQNTVSSFSFSGTTVYVAGNFSAIGGQSRRSIAALDVATGIATSWDPSATGAASALAVSGDKIYVGGSFNSVGGDTRNGVAAIDSLTGNVTSWDPNAGGIFGSVVEALVFSGTTLYAGGWFTDIGGQSRNFIAELDAVTGNATSWNPNAGGYVLALAVSGTTMYAAGNFNSMGGQTRNNIAAIDIPTGLPTGWNPNSDNAIYALAVSGTSVYAGGVFTNIGGQPRNNIAALDTSTGNATAWNPNANNYVFTIAASGSVVYAGGDFTSIGGQSRNYVAALDTSAGNATAWNPNSNTWVRALAVSGTSVFVGGYFSTIGGLARSGIAEIDASTGNATGWNPDLHNISVPAFAIHGTNLYALGRDGFFVASTLPSPLYPPTNLDAVSSATVDKGIDLSWTASVTGDAAGYRIYRSTSSFTDTAGAFIAAVGLVSSYQDVVPDYGEYFYRVATQDVSGSISTLSNEANTVAPDHSPPIEATGLTATASTSTDKQIDLSWTASVSGDVVAYLIYRHTASFSDTSTHLLAQVGAVTVFNDATPTYGTYFYRIVAKDSSGNLSAASTETSAASPDHTQPGTPMSLTATAGDGQVTITWRRSTDSDFARYRIYRSTSANATTQIDSSSSVSDTSRTYTGLTKGTTYFFRLAAVDNANNQSTYSNEASATVFAIAPTITTGVLQNPALSKYFAIAVVSLSDLASIPSVKLWITGTPDTLTITMSALSGSSHVYTGAGEFSSSGTYNIRTRAASSSGADTVQTNTYTVALAKPGLLTTLVASNNNASLQVNKRSVKEETYFLSNLTHIGTEIIYHFGPSTTEFVEALDIEIGFESGVYPDEGKLFIYHKDGQEWKALRSQVYADRSTVKARVTQLGEFKIVYDATFAGTNLVPTSYALGQNYPNPFNPSTTIRYELPEDGFLTMRIYNLLGQEVKTLVRGVQTAGVQTVVWDGRNANGQIVATGIYLYRIETKRFTQTKKMMFIK